MATFILIAGGWQGGWVYENVANILTRHEHKALSITLPGLGDVPAPTANLQTHIDVVARVVNSQQGDLIIVGQSYGGMVVSGAADADPSRIQALVYVDAYVRDSGDSVWSLTTPRFREIFIDGAKIDGLNCAPSTNMDPRCRPHPIGTFLQSIDLSGRWREVPRKTFVGAHGCPCALVISVPAAIAASLSAGAKRGLLMKGGAVLEGLGKIDAVAFDKTGTLTLGKPQVTDIVSLSRPASEVLRLAATLEAGSSHPLATAILARAAADMVAIPAATGSQALGGKGVVATVERAEIFFGSPQAANDRLRFSTDQAAEISALNGEGKTVSVLLINAEVAGAIAMRDEPRPDALAGLKALADVGVRTIMLTGDNARTAAAVGEQLGIEVRAELLPQDKQHIVGELKRQGLTVAKVGDGINDAPALAAADIGIAMGGGTDVALETADAAVLHGRVGDVAAMIRLSQHTMANIRQNIAIALGLKAVFLVTTVLGITGLWPAILADTGATVLVTANALRLLNWKGA